MDRQNYWVYRFNVTQGIVLLTSTALFAVYIGINVHREANMTEKVIISTGAPPQLIWKSVSFDGLVPMTVPSLSATPATAVAPDAPVQVERAQPPAAAPSAATPVKPKP